MARFLEFHGIFPRITEDNLPTNSATVANDVNLRSGRLEPWRVQAGLINRETGNYAWKDLWKTNLSFTGQKCHLNYIAIKPAGEICQACLGVNAHSNIFEDMDFGKNYRIPDVHCWVGYCGANCCTELIKVDEKESDENG